MTSSSRGIWLAIGILALGFAGSAGAQENLDQGKTAAQLYASDCAICHKSPQGLAKAGGFFKLESFLREHYTASRESAAAIAGYLKGVNSAGPARVRGRAAKRSVKDEVRIKAGDKKHHTGKADEDKSGAATSHERKPAKAKASEPKSSEHKSSEGKPSGKSSEAKASKLKSSGPKSSEPKSSRPKSSGPKAAGDAKSEKSEKSN
jgi:hypothetical protein